MASPFSLPDRAIIPRHCTHCDGLVRLHIRVRTKRPITREWACPHCRKKNDITGRWQFMTVVRDFEAYPGSRNPAAPLAPHSTDRRQ